MQISIQVLVNQENTIHSDYADWYNFYLEFIIPKLSYEQIEAEYQRARFINTGVIKNGRQWQFMHNLLIFAVVNDLAYQNMIAQNDSLQIAEIKANEQTNFMGTLIFETLDIVSRHYKVLPLKEIYKQLLILNNVIYWKTIYPKQKFNETNFCRFIHISMRTYQTLSKENANQ